MTEGGDERQKGPEKGDGTDCSQGPKLKRLRLGSDKLRICIYKEINKKQTPKSASLSETRTNTEIINEGKSVSSEFNPQLVFEQHTGNKAWSTAW